MNAKQARFVAEYLKDGNATQAAIRAGYSENGAGVQGHNLLKNPKIAEAIAKAQEKVIERGIQAAVITKDWLSQKWVAIHDSAMGDNPIVDRYGNPTGTVQKNYAGANKALEMLARLHGLLVEVNTTLPPDSWQDIVKGVYGSQQSAESGDNSKLH